MGTYIGASPQYKGSGDPNLKAHNFIQISFFEIYFSFLVSGAPPPNPRKSYKKGYIKVGYNSILLGESPRITREKAHIYL